MVKVNLAGMNVPISVLEGLKKLRDQLDHFSDNVTAAPTILKLAAYSLDNKIDQFTPEPIAAAYARISRSEKNVDELVVEACEDVPKARKSNESIVFGLGHHSVADHAKFNFNVSDVSRLVVEEIEKRRIGAGYTEKSQRYVTLDGDFIRPKEFSPEDLAKFERLVERQNEFYFMANKKMLADLMKKHDSELKKLSEKDRKRKLTDLEGKAKEDARYSLSLATSAQLGCSYDGETVEHAIRTMKYGLLEEEREFAKQVYDAVVKVAPSLIQLADADVFEAHNPGKKLDDNNFKYGRSNLKKLVKRVIEESPLIDEDYYHNHYSSTNRFKEGNVYLISNYHQDTGIIASAIFENSRMNFKESYFLAEYLVKEGKGLDFIKESLKYMSAFDKTPRAFEFGAPLVFEVNLSSSGFGQLKRHRMMTLISQDYDPNLGIVVPPSVEEADLKDNLVRICDESSELYFDFKPRYDKAAEYCLTNAHQKRALVGMNMRELYHFTRLRSDAHAQWEIRDVSDRMAKLANRSHPYSTILLGGKSQFAEKRDKVYK